MRSIEVKSNTNHRGLYFRMEGFIKLHRKIVDWEWYDDSNTFRLFVHLLLKANHEESPWHGKIIKRGQRFTSIGHLSRELNISEKAIRISIEKLTKTHEIKCEGASNGTMITVCNYDNYQSNPKTEGRTEGRTKGEQRANKGRTRGERGATNKNDNNDNNDNNDKNDKNVDDSGNSFPEKPTIIEELEDQKKSFYKSLFPYMEKYPKDMLREFYNYWTEEDMAGKKMRFQAEKFFKLERRLATWEKNESKFKPNNQKNGQPKQNYRDQLAEDRKHGMQRVLETLLTD